MISLIRAAWQEELRVPMFVGLSTDGYPDSDDPAMKNGARIYHMDTGSEYEYSIDDDAWYPVSNGSGGASTWNQLNGKPFSTIGDGLEVDSDNNLNVVGEVVDIGSNYYMYESYFLPAINATDLRTIYANHKENKLQVVKWTLLGSETYFNVLSADCIAGIYSLDILVHNKYHCQYNFADSTTGDVNPEVLAGGMVVTAHLSLNAGEPEVSADKTYEEVLGRLMSGGNVVVRAIYEGDDRIYLMSFLGAKYNEITFVDDEGIRVGANEDGWYVIFPE